MSPRSRTHGSLPCPARPPRHQRPIPRWAPHRRRCSPPWRCRTSAGTCPAGAEPDGTWVRRSPRRCWCSADALWHCPGLTTAARYAPILLLSPLRRAAGRPLLQTARAAGHADRARPGSRPRSARAARGSYAEQGERAGRGRWLSESPAAVPTATRSRPPAGGVVQQLAKGEGCHVWDLRSVQVPGLVPRSVRMKSFDLPIGPRRSRRSPGGPGPRPRRWRPGRRGRVRPSFPRRRS